jgi:hypothetical protein
MALVDFGLGVMLARRALPLLRQVEAPAVLRPDLEAAGNR